MQRVRCYLLFAGLTMFTRFDANKSTKGASKLRRDLINAEIANLRDLLPLPASTRQRLSQLQLMALVCVYVRKTNYFQQAFKNHNATLSAATPSIGFSKALNGFLMMMTQNGKLLYISDNATEYLGHSMEDLLIHGDSVYDIIDKQDHGVIQAEMSRSSTSDEREEPRMFMCRINVTRNARRQMRFGDQKVVLVRGHYLSFLPLCSRNEPVFIATCTPVAMPETRECVVQGATNVFTSIHSMDMKFMYLDRIGEYHLGYIWVELQGVSWYKLLHWECMQEAQAKHRLITQSDQDRACILLVRLQKRAGDWVWIHCVLQVKDNIENNQHPVIVCTNQILTEREAIVMRSNSWLYEYYMVQSKLQYGLTYGGHSTASRTTPFYHHHSPQSVIPPIQNHLHHHGQPPDSEIASPHVQGISIVQSHIGISATDHNRIMTEPPLPGPSHHGIEKVEPVDYSVHQASPHQHLYPLGHQIEGASRFFPAHTFIDDNSHIFPKLRVEETDPHLVYGHSYRPDTITHHSFSPSTDSPDTYSYQQLGSDNIDTSVYSEVPVSGYPMYVQHEVDNSVRRRKSSVQSLDGTDSDKYKLKHRKSSVESYSSDAASMLRADNENVDDVFLKQWKRRASPDPDENSWQRNKTPRISNEGRTSRLSSQQSLSNLSFQTISDTGTNQLNNNSAEHADKVTHSNLNNKQELTQNQILLKGSGSFNHWNEFSSPFQPKLYSFETTQGELCYPVTTATTKDDCICCRDQLENYNTAIYRDLVTDQYITSKIFADSKVPINAAKMYNLTPSNCQIQWPMDHLIYPLKPPPVARVDVSPMSIESPADGEHLPVSYEKQA